MTFVESYPCIRIVVSVLSLGFYIGSFASKNWVVVADGTIEWGLWSWCYTNFTDTDNASEFVNDTDRCHGIAPGDSPAYFEGVRTVACFTLLAFLALLLTFDENNKEGWGVDKRPCIVSWIAALLSAITLGILGGDYEEDERWKTHEPKLGWCVWLAMCACIFCFILGGLTWKYDEMKKCRPVAPAAPSGANGATTTETTPAPPASVDRPAVSRRASSSSSESDDVSVHSQAAARGKKSNRVSVHFATENDTVQRERTSHGAEFPVLRLPRYDLPPEPRNPFPDAPPPSYEDVMSGRYDNDRASPPPPILVSDSAHNRLNIDHR